ncbi:MAG: HYC_CC_PP family protein [Flavobacteriales bacterium]
MYRFLSFSLAVFMLVSSIGFTLNVHYCQKTISGISFLGTSHCCHGMGDHDQCTDMNQSSDSESKNDCCHNEKFKIEKSDSDTTLPQITSNQELNLDCILPLLFICLFESCIETTASSHRPYKPPLPDRDFHILFQTFLI